MSLVLTEDFPVLVFCAASSPVFDVTSYFVDEPLAQELDFCFLVCFRTC